LMVRSGFNPNAEMQNRAAQTKTEKARSEFPPTAFPGF